MAALVAVLAWAAPSEVKPWVAGTGAVLLAVFLVVSLYRHRQIRRLAEEIDEVLHSGRTVDFSNCREGDVAVLANELSKMVSRLSRTRDQLARERNALADSLADDLRRRLLDGEPLSGAGEEFSYPVVQDEATGLYVILRQPQVFDRGTMNILYTISLSSALVCLALAVVLSLALSRQLFQPIQRLHKAIREVAHNNLDVYVSHEHNDELGQLADRFNDMLVALKRNQEQLLENQRERNEAQIRMLQAQLNPHFLCNTLDTMKWISKIHHVPQVADMSTNLADILRFCISPEEFVPLRRETEIVARYVEIQRIRLSGSFAFVLDIPPELEEALVPKMMLQPIVENALLHGLSGQPDGAVEVRARREGAVLRLTVLDNGVGLPPELEGPYACRDQEETRGHLGLYNVDTILRKHYGEQFGLCLENRPDGTGTMVTATLPLRYKEDASSC